MNGRVCLVTGATSGIGRVTARELARRGATVVVHGRNAEKCAAAVEEIRRTADNPAVEALVADLSSLAAVRRMADEFRGRYRSLHVLVNNAGLSLNRRYVSADGYELMFAVNHLAHFLLTNRLWDMLQASAPARVINVSSGLHKYSRLRFDDLQATRKFSAMQDYGASKLANLLFTYELARRRAGTGVTVNAFNPGMTATNIGREEGGLFSASKKVMDRLFGKSAEEGARTLVWLATAPEVADVTGGYFENLKAISSSPASYDEAAARRLWEESERMMEEEEGD